VAGAILGLPLGKKELREEVEYTGSPYAVRSEKEEVELKMYLRYN
jgi:hypothetical protein